MSIAQLQIEDIASGHFRTSKETHIVQRRYHMRLILLCVGVTNGVEIGVIANDVVSLLGNDGGMLDLVTCVPQSVGGIDLHELHNQIKSNQIKRVVARQESPTAV
jgi:hypothetical protein